MSDWETTGTSGIAAPGGASSLEIAQPLPLTFLSLERYAKIMGIPPLSFATAIAKNNSGSLFNYGGTNCDDIWWKYDWQDNDKVSHYSLVDAIKRTEDDIMAVIGYPMAPMWIEQEVHDWPRHHRPDIYGGYYDIKGMHKGIFLDYGKLIGPGQRSVTLIDDDVVPTLHDLDSDGFYETVRVSVATAYTDVTQLKVYFADTDADPRWEIRSPKKKTLSGGTLTVEYWTWQLIDPDLREAFPLQGDTLDAFDLTGDPPSNIVGVVDVYREYNDYTQTSATLIWEPEQLYQMSGICSVCGGSGCTCCALTTQDGCLHVRDANLGMAVPVAATYDSDNDQWTADATTYCREPDMVKVYYYAGEYSQEFLKGREYEPLSNFWAQIIARMATSRLERSLCTCGNAYALSTYLMEDMARVRTTEGDSRMVDLDMLGNPFGTRVGEVEAWTKISKLLGGSTDGGAV